MNKFGVANRFNYGFAIFFSAVRFWSRDRKLLGFSVVPLIIDIIFMVSSLVYAVPRIPSLVNEIMGAPDVWYKVIWYSIVFALTAVSVLLIVVLITILVANLVTFPFNNLLSKRALSLKLTENQRLKFAAKKAKGMTNAAAMARKTVVLVIAGLFLFIATLVPGLAIIAGFVGMLIMAYDRVDYAFDELGLSFKQRKSFIKAGLVEFVGFALALGLTSFIPVINIVLIPASVVGGACLVAGLLQRNPQIERFDSSTTR